MKKVLYIGFKGKNNASCTLARHLTESPILLTNSFDGLRKDMEQIEEAYDGAFLFGIDTKLKDSVRIEYAAERQGSVLTSELDLSNISKHLDKAGVANYISNIPTHYLCNEAYWFALHKFHKKAVFIHIPSSKNISEDFLEKMKTALWGYIATRGGS